MAAVVVDIRVGASLASRLPRARRSPLPAGPDQAEAKRTMLGEQIPAIRMVSASGSVARGVVDGVATEVPGWSG